MIFVHFNVKMKIVNIFVLTLILMHAVCRGVPHAPWHDLAFVTALSLPAVPWCGECLPHFIPDIQLSSLTHPRWHRCWRSDVGFKPDSLTAVPISTVTPVGGDCLCSPAKPSITSPLLYLAQRWGGHAHRGFFGGFFPREDLCVLLEGAWGALGKRN